MSNQPSDHMVVAIDGPAGAGKSTVAKQLAKKLNLSYLDTGAMYRALTLKAMRSSLDLENDTLLVNLAKNTKIELFDKDGEVQVMLDGDDVSQAIRTPEVTQNTRYIACTAGVREIMVEWQRAMGEQKSVIVEGRDTTTVVFPNATYKFFLDAEINERANRRSKEYTEKGEAVDQGELKEAMEKRDLSDTSREVGALKRADDAVYIDTTGFSVEEVADMILEKINS